MAAGKVLKYGLAVRNPDTFEAVSLAAGTKKADLPDWAQELVHDDDFGSAEESAAAEGSTGDEPEDYASMSPEELAKMAEDRQLEVTGTGANGNVKKGDLVAALTAADEAGQS